MHLAQQATLETRDAKHDPLAEQRTNWLAEAAEVLGSPEAVAAMVRTALTPPAETTTIIDASWFTHTASRIVTVMDSSEVRLADGNQASVGDMIITRSNDRRLRLSATDWVKNGDRWTITGIGRRGDLTVRHSRIHLTVRLPIDYVRTSTGLGYATTIHAAQGVSADTMHGLLTGRESRQQLYTMLTHGRYANHLHLQVVGDGDPHSLIRPEAVTPRTPTEILQRILARDDSPSSATTLLRELSDPAARLHDAVQRYTDGLHVAAEQLVGPQTVVELDQADQYIPGLTNEPAWPTLRAHLLDIAAETGKHPIRHMLTAAVPRLPLPNLALVEIEGGLRPRWRENPASLVSSSSAPGRT